MMPMNAMEKLAREIIRLTVMRSRYEALRSMPNVIVAPQIAMQTASIERACIAVGSNDPALVLQALADLKSYED